MNEPIPTFSERLDTIILTNLQDDDFSIKKLSSALALSYSHCYRKIREQTDLTPSMYLCKKRLEVACQLLLTTDLTMGEIAFKVGFNTQAYFSKCFSQVYGCAPLRYKKQLLERKEGVSVALI